MKTHIRTILVLGLTACLAHIASGAAVFYSFDLRTDGTGAFTDGYSAIQGFSYASSITRTGTTQASGHAGGATFKDFEGTTWTGGGGSSTPGHSLTWNQNSTGNSFSMTLNTTGLESLVIRMDIRSAGGGAPTSFSSFTYSIGDGEAVNITVSSPSISIGSTYNEWSIDLSSITALNNQNSITLTWTLPDLGASPSIRIDNLQITATAIPEPTTMTAIMASFAILLPIAIRCRRRTP